MTPSALPPDVFDALPPAVQAYIRYLELRLADLEARLGQNSTNSSRPPSSDPPRAKPAPPKVASGKRKGGQRGHPKRTRPDLPPDTVIELRPDTCDRCSRPLCGDDPRPLRHHVVELPPIRPVVTEYRRHRLACPSCGRVNGPGLPVEVRGGYGPRVQAACALLSYSAYDHLPDGRRQVCWAHLRRDSQAMIDRRNDGAPIGEQLLALADMLLGQWKRVRDGAITRGGFRTHYLIGIRAAIHVRLRSGRECRCAKTAGVCRELLKLGPALYTFAAEEGVEPTNNVAERALRHAVCWRKTSYGTDSARGTRFVERVLTVVASCQQQGRNILAFLTDAIQAAREGTPAPSLIPTTLATL